MNKKLQIGIIGSAGSDDYRGARGATQKMQDLAFDLGRILACNNCNVVTGGKSGIMQAAAKGAKESGGITIGVVKGKERFTSNNYVDVEVISGMEANGMDELLIVNMCDALIAVGGGAGTLQEMCLAYRNNKPVIALASEEGWAQIMAGKYFDNRRRMKVIKTGSAKEAVEAALNLFK